MSHSKAEVSVLLEAMAHEERIILLSADLATSCGLSPVMEAYPHRVINVGIAEQNMLGIAAGLAREGMFPWTHTFSTFASMRSCEQLRTDIFYNQLNVKVMGTHGGLSTGPAGSTHFALEDMGIVRAMPQSLLVAPSDDASAAALTRMLLEETRPVYMRLDRNDLPAIYTGNERFALGGSHVLLEGSDVALLAMGAMVHPALEAAEKLRRFGICASVADMYSIKPLDEALVRSFAQKHSLLVTLEEHHIIGGLGSAVAESMGSCTVRCPLLRIGLKDDYPMGGPVEVIREREGLSANRIAQKITEEVGRLCELH